MAEATSLDRHKLEKVARMRGRWQLGVNEDFPETADLTERYGSRAVAGVPVAALLWMLRLQVMKTSDPTAEQAGRVIVALLEELPA